MHMQMGEDGSYISEVKATYLGEHKFRVEFDGVSTDVHLAVYNKVNAFFKCIWWFVDWFIAYFGGSSFLMLVQTALWYIQLR